MVLQHGSIHPDMPVAATHGLTLKAQEMKETGLAACLAPPFAVKVHAGGRQHHLWVRSRTGSTKIGEDEEGHKDRGGRGGR